ncbi:phosphatidate cytidylyltransferase [bacterium]|nr:phosphatidate cytidylyltransferase [bacterium]
MASPEFTKNETRMLTGFVIGLIVLGCLYFGGVFLLLLIAACMYIGSKEYVEILKHKGFFPSLKIILISDIVFAVLFCINNCDFIFAAVTLAVITSFMWVLFKGRQPYIANVATTLLGVFYGGWLTLHLFLLRGLSADGTLDISMHNSQGIGYVFFLFFVILATDMGCYFVGRKIGKNQLAPTVSPKKTIEGAVGGFVCSVITALCAGFLIDLPWYHAFILGVICSVLSQIGDLCESLIKRDAGVKDSSDIIPGHGGFLDRTDSYVFTMPIMYYYLKLFIVNPPFDYASTLKGFLHGFGL